MCTARRGINTTRSLLVSLHLFLIALLSLDCAQVNAQLDVTPNVKDPNAVNAQTVCPGYSASNVVQSPTGLTADLSLAGEACNIYGNDVDHLSLTVEYQATDQLHVEITPTFVDSTNSSWFALPEQLISKPSMNGGAASTSDLNFTWSNDPTFSFTVVRKSTGDQLFSTNGTKLVFEDQFIEFVSTMPENYNLYGLGDLIQGFRLGNNLVQTFWNGDIADTIDTNLYGTHPFYLDTRYFQVNNATGGETYVADATDPTANYTSYSHGVYLRNAHGQDVILNSSDITWRTIGGDIDLYFFSGPTQQKVTQAYQTSAVGLPAMQQYWTFGYHQCRWGYQNWSNLEDVIANMSAADLPLETIWTDIDYMDGERDFTTNPISWAQWYATGFLERLHANGQHYVLITDPAIYYPEANPADNYNYPTFDRGNATDSFIMNPDNSLFVGKVWPGYTVWPDWIGSSLAGSGANQWWLEEVTTFHQNLSFDGMWIDMTGKPSKPPSMLCHEIPAASGSYLIKSDLSERPTIVSISIVIDLYETRSCGSANVNSDVVQKSLGKREEPNNVIDGRAVETSNANSTPTPGVRNINWPLYVLNNVRGDLADGTVSPNATHHGGYAHYDFHNLFGLQTANATYHALLNVFPGKRPFIIGRSTFAGTGKVAGHWGGDNYATFQYMYFSIPQALSFSLFGIPMFGVDTCGYAGEATEELCNRWMQLSAFFPFYRNHHSGDQDQEPYRWESVADATRIAAGIRYLLLPYIYTTYNLAHTTGTTVMRALAWEFPNEPLLASTDRQFLLGGSLMIIPVLDEGSVTVGGVFPGALSGQIWYDWYNQTAISAGPGQNITIDAPLGHIPVYIRGGSVLPTQEAGNTTATSRSNPWGLIAALDASGQATGQLYVDDGESITPDATLDVNFAVSGSSLKASSTGSYVDNNALANVTVLGVSTAPSDVLFNNASLSNSWTYDNSSLVLAVTNLNSVTSSGAWSSDWVLSWS
ncbi:MAG: hypothetical protein M1818_002132 [Claussenomyces sp. TS43310]|nr:MAG: hypothetical protein M1818_002132 [Claussenomyces sp. TS43310]